MASLKYADLSGATDLTNATLEGATLEGADLSDADLKSVNLKNANMSGVNLSDANLTKTNMKFTDLSSTSYEVTQLNNADLSSAFLLGANLSGAEMPNANLKKARMYGADLSYANLHNVNLSGANLKNANLMQIFTGYAHTSGGDVNYIHPTRATIEVQLRQVRSLKGTTMPNGQKYKDWLEGNDIYSVDKFDTAFRFEAGKGWQLSSQTDNAVYIEYLPEGASPFRPSRGQISFTSPLHVFDPSNLSEPEKAPAPANTDEWLSWFQRHPNLETSKPVPVSIGGASGMRIDATAENYFRGYCGPQASCLPLYPGIVIPKSYKDRFIILDVKGETVIIDVSAASAENKFDEFLPQAQKVLDTIEWEGP